MCVKDITLHFSLLDFVRKCNLYAKITLCQKRFVSKLSCKQTARLIFPSYYCMRIVRPLFIYATFIKRSIHKQTCSNALFNKYIYTVVSIVDIILLTIKELHQQ